MISWPKTRNSNACLAAGLLCAGFVAATRDQMVSGWFVATMVAVFILLAFFYRCFSAVATRRMAALVVIMPMIAFCFVLGAPTNVVLLPGLRSEWVMFALLMVLLIWAWFDPEDEALSAVVVPRMHSAWASVRGLLAYLLPSMLMAVPLSLFFVSAKTELTQHKKPPFTTASGLVVFEATFQGKAPEDPYWRQLGDMPYPIDEFQWPIVVEQEPNPASNWGYAPPTQVPGGSDILTYRFDPQDLAKGVGVVVNLDGTFFQSRTSALENGVYWKAFEHSYRQQQGNAPPGYWYGAVNFADIPSPDTKNLDNARRLMPKTVALVQSWKAQGLKDQALVDKALAYFQQNLAYNFDHQSQDPEKLRVDYFLFTDKKGVCRHFANSFAIMMRLGGVPSRLVGGFKGGVFDPDTNSYTVRQKDGHVWVEVWLPQTGWKRVDPTSVVPVEKGIPNDPFDIQGLASKFERANLRMNSLFSVGHTVRIGKGEPSEPKSSWTMPSLRVVLAALFLLAFASLFVFRRKRKPKLPPNEKAWLALLEAIRRRGFVLPVSAGPATIGAHMQEHIDPLARAQWLEGVIGYEQWKFGQHQDPSLARKLGKLRALLPKKAPTSRP